MTPLTSAFFSLSFMDEEIEAGKWNDLPAQQKKSWKEKHRSCLSTPAERSSQGVASLPGLSSDHPASPGVHSQHWELGALLSTLDPHVESLRHGAEASVQRLHGKRALTNNCCTRVICSCISQTLGWGPADSSCCSV